MNDHPEERLGRYPDLLDEQERADVEQHLDGCERCRQEVARLQGIRQAAAELAKVEVQPSADLDRRALARIRAEARLHAPRPLWWRARVVAAPIALAAAVVLAVVLRAPDDARPPDDPWTVKGAGETSEDATLQVAKVEDRSAVPLAQGDHVPGGATLLLGGTVPAGQTATVFLVQGERRTEVWRGVGTAETAEGGALMMEGAPATVRAPVSGAFQLEIWLDSRTGEAATAAADRFGLVADPGE